MALLTCGLFFLELSKQLILSTNMSSEVQQKLHMLLKAHTVVALNISLKKSIKICYHLGLNLLLISWGALLVLETPSKIITCD